MESKTGSRSKSGNFYDSCHSLKTFTGLSAGLVDPGYGLSIFLMDMEWLNRYESNRSSENVFYGGSAYSYTLYRQAYEASINYNERLNRYQDVWRSFQKHRAGFPAEKENYVDYLANEVCKLRFVDNLSYYNNFDETIETILKLDTGLKLSISQFLDEDVDAPAVFLIHRGEALLVSDEMPVSEIVGTINSVKP